MNTVYILIIAISCVVAKRPPEPLPEISEESSVSDPYKDSVKLEEYSSELDSDDRSEVTTLKSLPFQALLEMKRHSSLRLGTFFCEGALISSVAVLTTGRCLIRRHYAQVYLAIYEGDKLYRTKSSELIVHENYKETDNSITNNIGLVILDQPLLYSDVCPIDLPPKANVKPQLDGQVAKLLSWEQPPRDAIIIPKLDCAMKYKMQKEQICTELYVSLDTDEVKRSQGAVLTLNNSVIGIATLISPSVVIYTRVDGYIDWIMPRAGFW